jgi:signal transduction histidine kinase/ActR/RegA family two-component response regulator
VPNGRYESEGWRLRKDGTRFWALAVVDAVRDEDARLLGFAKITRDMTERREAQIQLERAQNQLAQSQKMEAIGHLTGGIAHDFNNLLMIVSGQVQLMKLRLTDDRDRRSLEAIEQAARSGANLTRQLLTFARRQTMNRITIDLRERLRAIRDLLASSLGGAIHLSLDIPPDLWRVETDPAELELALVNIAVNARDAMPQGGSLTIKARNVVLDEHGPAGLDGEFVALSLRDTGTGIPAEVQSRIFEPFFTTKDLDKGTGLGLSQVYGFAHQCGGDVRIASGPGQGTTVTLFLLRSLAEQTVPQPTPPSHDDDVCGRGRVLVVEDNLHVGDVSVLLLEQLGYQVVRTERPNGALALLAREDDIALVFSDIVMPGTMDGLALAHEIRQRYPDLPVLLATGYSSAAERVGAQFPIIRKPYDFDALARAVKSALTQPMRQSALG